MTSLSVVADASMNDEAKEDEDQFEGSLTPAFASNPDGDDDDDDDDDEAWRTSSLYHLFDLTLSVPFQSMRVTW
jgi:hypothetical protein